jgi:hypothetical protein
MELRQVQQGGRSSFFIPLPAHPQKLTSSQTLRDPAARQKVLQTFNILMLDR